MGVGYSRDTWLHFRLLTVRPTLPSLHFIMRYYLFWLETEDTASKNPWLAFPNSPVELPEARRREQIQEYITYADQHASDRFYTGTSKSLF